MRFLLILLISIFSHSVITAQQDAMLQNKRKKNKVWRRWSPRERKNKTAYNPYLRKKDKDKPSAQAAAGNKREIRKQRKDYKRQLKQGKKKTR